MLSTTPACEAMIACQLLPNEIKDERLLKAMTSLERTRFVPEIFSGVAYADEDIFLASDRWMLRPLTLAKLLQAAELKPSQKLLYVGCGTGYGAAVAAMLVRRVIAVESHPELADIARHNLQGSKGQCDIFSAPLTAGYPLAATYDVIVLEGAVQQLPAALAQQLAEGGVLVAVKNRQQRPESKSGMGELMLLRKRDGVLQESLRGDVPAPILPGFEARPGFVF
jgi:protein-L-isoaspartate(D-aspartate) O-methyltransferase